MDLQFRVEVISAADAGAPHRRERIWILANANREWQLQPQGGECDQWGWAGDGGCQIRDSASQGLSHRPNQSLERPGQNAKPERSGWWTTEPDVGVLADGLSPDVVPGWWEQEPDIARVATGVQNRVGQLKAIGNAQVPLQAALAWRILSDAISR